MGAHKNVVGGKLQKFNYQTLEKFGNVRIVKQIASGSLKSITFPNTSGNIYAVLGNDGNLGYVSYFEGESLSKQIDLNQFHKGVGWEHVHEIQGDKRLEPRPLSAEESRLVSEIKNRIGKIPLQSRLRK